ncbi:FtsX-like permease family protein [Corynebacterium meitnerae]|uniref:FtsX-like permease family protein n=1 Tax=Corynebacterium meitnerae TaxID=2913498 RepID=A0A9X3LUV9_9CORY|nr:FtsX-like permease family protein [Corynebacterium meitnerae]MCZ9294615.1 FtsX-like permease family protein [Corynebacterium meitnerae]
MSAMTLMTAAQSSTAEGRAQRQTGERWVRALSLVAFSVSTWILCTLAAGTWMFAQRMWHPHEAVRVIDADLDGLLTLSYVFLALFASLLVVPTLLGLLTQAARANLGGREEQLAILRLIGATSGQVRGMMILDALRQALVGLGIGTVLYLVSVPAWSLLTFQEKRIGTWEMFTWWIVPVAWLVVLVLAAASVWLALRRVAVTPLGVTKKIPPKGQSAITLVISLVAAFALYRYLSTLTIAPGANAMDFIMLLVVVAGVLMVNALIAVGVIQLIARFSYLLPGSANYVATRRVGRGARTTWKRVAALYFLAFTAGISSWISAIPEIDADPALNMITGDIPTGVALTAVFGAILLVASTLLTQALAVVEQKQLTKSLYFVGAPAKYHTSVAIREIGVPMVLVTLLGFGMGNLLGFVMVAVPVDVLPQLTLFAALIALVLAGCIAAVAATGELRERVLTETGRLND